MDKNEQDILNLLKEDSRYGAEKIAVMLGLDKNTVENTIALLEQKGVIVKYTTLVNEDKNERDYVEALIEVKITPQKAQGFDAIAKEICAFEEVKDCYLMSGGYDLTVVVEGKTLKEVAMFVSEKLSAIDNVLSTSTHFILKKYKSEGILFSSDDDIERIAIL